MHYVAASLTRSKLEPINPSLVVMYVCINVCIKFYVIRVLSGNMLSIER